MALLMERNRLSPYGLAGGQSGQTGEATLHRNGKSRKMRGKAVFSVCVGDKLIINTPGGGGWGDETDP